MRSDSNKPKAELGGCRGNYINTWSDSERRPFGLLLCWGWYSGKSFVTRFICLPLALSCSSAVKAAAAAALSLADWAGGVVVSAYVIIYWVLYDNTKHVLFNDYVLIAKN